MRIASMLQFLSHYRTSDNESAMQVRISLVVCDTARKPATTMTLDVLRRPASPQLSLG